MLVLGRNGFEYEAKHVSGDLYIVGRFVVRVVDRKVVATVCRATKSNIANL